MMTTWVTIIGIGYSVIYLAAIIYGWRHQEKPFWRGFCNPFNL